MPSTFTGIQNENEFYSHHYLTEVFTGDIKETIARWRKAAAEDKTAQTPDRALRTLTQRYRAFRQLFSRERRDATAWEAARRGPLRAPCGRATPVPSSQRGCRATPAVLRLMYRSMGGRHGNVRGKS